MAVGCVRNDPGFERNMPPWPPQGTPRMPPNRRRGKALWVAPLGHLHVPRTNAGEGEVMGQTEREGEGGREGGRERGKGREREGESSLVILCHFHTYGENLIRTFRHSGNSNNVPPFSVANLESHSRNGSSLSRLPTIQTLAPPSPRDTPSFSAEMRSLLKAPLLKAIPLSSMRCALAPK